MFRIDRFQVRIEGDVFKKLSIVEDRDWIGKDQGMLIVVERGEMNMNEERYVQREGYFKLGNN